MKKRRTHLKGRNIPKFKIEIDGKIYKIDPAADLFVSEDMDREFSVNPSLFAWYATLAEAALELSKEMKLELDEKLDELRTKYRQKHRDSSGRLTVAEVNARVNQSPVIKKLNRRLIAAESFAGKLKSYKEAFNQRSFMLISKGAHRRAEGEISLLEDRMRDTTKRSRKER